MLLTSAILAVAPLVAQEPGRIAHASTPEFVGWVQDELVVVLDERARRIVVPGLDPDGRPTVNAPSLQARLDAVDAERFARQFHTARPQPAGSPFVDLTGHYKVRLGTGVDLETAFHVLSADPLVDRVERIGMHTLYDTPDDPYYQDSPNPSFPYDQWHYWAPNGVDADLAWDSETGDSSVLVGILDSGTRYFHVDLGGPGGIWGPDAPNANGNVFVNGAETPGNGVDDDGNGFVDDTIGWDFVSSAGGAGVSCIDQDCSGTDNDPDDGDGHGTHVAGTVGAITNNGILVAGVAGGWSDGTGVGNGVRVVPLRIGYHARYRGVTTGVVRMDWAAEAMNYVSDLVDAGHNVAAINCSWGSSNSGGLGAAVTNLVAHDVVVVHAAGNSNSSSPDYLGGRSDVVNVAATDQNGSGASFTNHGSWVDVAAPGVDVLSTYRNPDDPDPNAHYIALLGGTSMAAPHVAGIVALLESCSPALSATAKVDAILSSATGYSDSRDLGAGIANADLALDASGCSGVSCDITAEFNASTTSGCGPLGVTFTDLSTGTGIDGWTWDFGDGNGSTAQNPSHTYSTPGTYSVTLTASSATCSDDETKTGYITVQDVPTAAFTWAADGLSVDFTDASGGSPTGWSWSFGDGGSSTAQSPTHVYGAAGTYTVTLTASNACGSDQTSQSVTVSDSTGPSTMFVGDITIGLVAQGPNRTRAEATITILDDEGNPVPNASVDVSFSGSTSSTGSGTTDGAGQVTFTSKGTHGTGSWCVTVDSVTHGTLSYEPASNVETSDCTP